VCDANAASCRDFIAEARRAIGAQVLALQRIEHEASDRLKGLDSRPFDVLFGETRKAVAVVADPVGLKEDEGLERCRNWTVPVRKICADAARAVADVLEKLVADPKPDFDRPRFAATVAECEKLMDLKPLRSVIRGTD